VQTAMCNEWPDPYGLMPAVFRLIYPEFPDPYFLKRMFKRGSQNSEAIFHAASKVDGGGAFEVFGWAGDLCNVVTVEKDLGEHLVVEDEIVGISVVVDVFEHFAGKGPVTGMVFGEFGADENVLTQRQDAVKDVFIPWHSAFQRPATKDPGTKYHRIEIECNEVRHGVDQPWGILIIRMKHDHDIGIHFEGFVVARFLVSAITCIVLMADYGPDTDLAGHFNSIVLTGIIHKNDIIHNIERDLVIGAFQCFRCIVGRKNDDYLFTKQHIG
jgi:hypothetical protein